MRKHVILGLEKADLDDISTYLTENYLKPSKCKEIDGSIHMCVDTSVRSEWRDGKCVSAVIVDNTCPKDTYSLSIFDLNNQACMVAAVKGTLFSYLLE